MLAEWLAVFGEELRLRRLQGPGKLFAICLAGVNLVALGVRV